MGIAELSGKKAHAIHSAEIVGSAFAIAYLNHKIGAGEIKLGAAANGTGGVPLDGAGGLAGVAFAFWKPESRYAPHALAVGLGLLAGFGYRTGAAMGDTAAVAAKAAVPVTTVATTAGVSMQPRPQMMPAQPHRLADAFSQFAPQARQASGIRR